VDGWGSGGKPPIIFLNSAPHTGEWTASWNPPPTCPGKAPLISTGWVPNVFYTLRKFEKTLPVSGIEIRIPRSSSACANHYSVSHNGSQTMQTRTKNEILRGADV